MSMMRCDRHGPWDSDFMEECPQCEGAEMTTPPEQPNAAPLCSACNGNGKDIPCAYPGSHERQKGCLRYPAAPAPQEILGKQEPLPKEFADALNANLHELYERDPQESRSIKCGKCGFVAKAWEDDYPCANCGAGSVNWSEPFTPADPQEATPRTDAAKLADELAEQRVARRDGRKAMFMPDDDWDAVIAELREAAALRTKLAAEVEARRVAEQERDEAKSIALDAESQSRAYEAIAERERERAEQAEAKAREDAKDAARYRWLRYRVGADRDSRGRQEFNFPDLADSRVNLFKGAVALHLDDAIDAAITERGEG